MKKETGIFFLTGAYVLMLLAMFILPFLMVPDQSFIKNTLSELGAQVTPYAWIMNAIFVILAIGSVISGWVYFEGFVFQRIILLLFGVSLFLAAIFNHAPVSPEIRFNIPEDGWHHYLINTAWLSFIILTFSTASIPEKPENRKRSFLTAVSSVFLLLLVSEADQTAGIWQRLQFIISFGWMITTYKTGEK